ncbi:MAG: YidC/Oxa1 family membrane protein insertase [Treponema sp.]|nr:YidC/Oxa1 family membrane protein insertase [Treponema sp.]
MSDFFYTLIIYPLTIVIESAYQLVYALFDNVGLATIGVSVAVSFLCLPLYIVAEKWQQTERDKQKQMEKGVQRIKKTFKGDEQYMILTTFYKQNHYHPMMALRSSFGLLIQVPFFIAAYSFLSSMPALQGQSFAFIRDMGKPDALFYIGTFPVNILPIAMTIINIAGSAVYTKGFKLKEKLPIYGMALLFLAILYDSPAGLVLYWTMNNVFSLAKNIFYKIKRPQLVLYIMACVAAALAIIYLMAIHNGLASKRILLAALFSLTFFIPLFVKAADWALSKPLKNLVDNKSERHILFLTAAISLSLLTGIVIPSNTITSSVVEFCNIDKIQNPNIYVLTAFLQSFGIFGFWFSCVYFLFGKKIQSLMAAITALLLLWGTANAFIFAGDYGSISRTFIFDKAINHSALSKTLNVIALLAITGAFLFLLKKTKAKNAILPFLFILLITYSSISVLNIAKIQKESSETAQSEIQEASEIKPALRLSKKGKNVVVIMADRAENAYAQTILNAYPKLKEAFKDWTLYSHTLSYDSHTLLGAPPLYGGYEYTPLEMNKRDKVPLKDKNNEALLLMPRIFTEQAGFEAQVFDLSWANYSWVSDMSICNPYPKITGENLERKYTSKWMQENATSIKDDAGSSTIKRNFLWFSIFKESPLFLRDAIYSDGSWWSSDEDFSDFVEFVSFYSVLDYLPELTAFDGNDEGDFVLLQSMATHKSIELQAPDFVPVKKVTNKAPFENFFGYDALSSNAAFFARLSEWMEYLKSNDCYDNTRIIVVADHGIGGMNLENIFFYDNSRSKESEQELQEELETIFGKEIDKTLIDAYAMIKYFLDKGYNFDHNHPLLMMKDFTDSESKAKREFTVDNSFMTNADTPALAFEGIIQNPVNPWTGKKIEKRTEAFAEGVVAGGRYEPGKNGLYQFDLNGIKIYDVKDDMANIQNWKERPQ